MTQLISFLHFLLTAVRTGRLGVLPVKIYRGNNAVFVSVDLIGEKNQVILELSILHGFEILTNHFVVLQTKIKKNPCPNFLYSTCTEAF